MALSPLGLVIIVFGGIVAFIAVGVLGAAIIATIRINTNAKKLAQAEADGASTDENTTNS